jgi:hypothetical protein
MEEAALVDGASHFHAFFKVALPLSVPGADRRSQIADRVWRIPRSAMSDPRSAICDCAVSPTSITVLP